MVNSQAPITITNDFIKITILGYQIKLGKVVETYDNMTELIKNLDTED